MYILSALAGSNQAPKLALIAKISDDIAAEEALAIIEENPTNFGVWDRFLDPTSAKVRVEKVRRQKSANQQIMENEIKLLELNEMKKAREESDYEEEVKEKETKDPPFRNLVTAVSRKEIAL